MNASHAVIANVFPYAVNGVPTRRSAGDTSFSGSAALGNRCLLIKDPLFMPLLSIFGSMISSVSSYDKMNHMEDGTKMSTDSPGVVEKVIATIY